eukprot:14231649-Alexandrium_andersonii.AAC.1
MAAADRHMGGGQFLRQRCGHGPWLSRQPIAALAHSVGAVVGSKPVGQACVWPSRSGHVNDSQLSARALL